MILRERVSINTRYLSGGWATPFENIFAKLDHLSNFFGGEMFENKHIFENTPPPPWNATFPPKKIGPPSKNDLILQISYGMMLGCYQSLEPINPDQSISTAQEIRSKKGELSRDNDG